MTPALHIDFETRSILDLKEVGLWNYVRHPSTDVWCMAWAFGDADPQIWIPNHKRPLDSAGWGNGSPLDGVQVVAHNAAFELAVWNEIMVPRYGWPRLDPAQVDCTMARCYAMGLPGGLEDAALALGLSVLKDIEGRAQMLRMARPRRMNGSTPVWWDEPERLARLYAYCQQDVRVEQALHKRLLPLSEHERKIQLMDWAINARGVAVDLETAAAGAKMAEEVKIRAGQKLAVITEGAVTEATALTALKQWLGTQGVFPPDNSLDKEHVDALLAGALPTAAAQALVLRQEAGKASVAKLDKIISLAGSDSRLHDAVQYHGAATGRWAARGVQVHNLVRDMPPAKVVEEILGHVRDGALEWIDMAYGPPMTMISRCLRSFFVAPEGKLLIAGDFSAVESRGGAWFSGENWKLKAFREADAGRGPGIYELTASKTLGIPVESIGKDSPERQVGKVQDLAFQYQGGVGAGRKFLPRSLADTPDKTINQWKLAWRDVHRMIVAGWKALEEAAISAVRNEGQKFTAGFPGRQVTFKKAGSFLWCQLPSGRVMCYPYPKLMADRFGDKLTYMTVPSTNDSGAIIADVKNANNWARVGTYGGSLMENVVQALCRDLLADCMLTLHEKGAPIVLHVHDEAVIEVPAGKAEAARGFMQDVLRTPPGWAKDFPLYADCKVMKRYGKGK